MSRSRRKRPVLKDGGNSHKVAKTDNNRYVRHTGAYLPKKGNYAHRYFYDWMHDSVRIMTREDAIRAWEMEEQEHAWTDRLHRRYGTLDRWLAQWRKTYVSK